MSHWTVGRKLYTGVGALLALLLLSGTVALYIASAQKARLDLASGETATKLVILGDLDSQVIRCQSGSRRFLVATYAKDQRTFDLGLQEVEDAVQQTDRLTREIEPLLRLDRGRQLVAGVRQRARAWKQEIDVAIGLARQDQPQEAWKHVIEKANPLIEEQRRDTAALIELQKGLLAEGVADGNRGYATAWWAIVSLLLVSVAVGAAVAWAVRGISHQLRGTASELREASEQVVSASSQVATSAQSLSQGATEQAASLEESSASMEEMGSMTHQNAEQASEAARLMQHVDQQVRESNRLLQDMVTSMSSIQESSGKVSKIIKTIDEIAFQTNILALNAAVEAARAGEAGMGFAVVADEVRSLAQRAAQAARDTAGLIEEASTNAQEGSEKVQRVTLAIGQFTESVAKVKAIADGVSAASHQQSQGIQQVSTAIQQMEKVTQTTAATAEESAAASEELNAQAETTMQLVERLESMVGGAAMRAAVARATRSRATRPAVRILPAPAQRTPEQQIPLDDTGTYGSF